jgi:hypothetical protein
MIKNRSMIVLEILIKTSKINYQFKAILNVKNYNFDSDTYLDINEFQALLKSLFSYNGNSYYLSKTKILNMYEHFMNKLV